MRRRWPGIFAAMSLLFSVASGVVWVRSYYVGDQVCWDSVGGARGRVQWAMAFRTGCVDFGRMEYGDTESVGGSRDYLFVTDYKSGIFWHKLPDPDETTMAFWYRGSYVWEQLGFARQELINVPMWDMGAEVKSDTSGWRVIFPMWFVVLVGAIVPGVWAVGILCGGGREGGGWVVSEVCSYDLRTQRGSGGLGSVRSVGRGLGVGSDNVTCDVQKKRNPETCGQTEVCTTSAEGDA